MQSPGVTTAGRSLPPHLLVLADNHRVPASDDPSIQNSRARVSAGFHTISQNAVKGPRVQVFSRNVSACPHRAPRGKISPENMGVRRVFRGWPGGIANEVVVGSSPITRSQREGPGETGAFSFQEIRRKSLSGYGYSMYREARVRVYPEVYADAGSPGVLCNCLFGHVRVNARRKVGVEWASPARTGNRSAYPWSMPRATSPRVVSEGRPVNEINTAYVLAVMFAASGLIRSVVLLILGLVAIRNDRPFRAWFGLKGFDVRFGRRAAKRRGGRRSPRRRPEVQKRGGVGANSDPDQLPRRL